MSKNKAYILGCSHVAGSEIEGWGIGHCTKFNLENSFLAQLAKLLNYEPENLAIPGASNDYIFRNFMYLINSNMIQPNDIVLVFWTGEERIEIQDPISKKWIQFSQGMSTNFPEYNSTHKDFYELYQRLMCMEPMRGRLNKIKNIYALNYIAKLKGIRVVNGDSFQEYGYDFKQDLPWLFPHDSFTAWADRNKYEHSPDWYHYGLDAHTDFAKLCLEEYNSKIVRKEKTNYWVEFLEQNLKFMSDKNKEYATKFLHNKIANRGTYDYNFCLDGWSSEAHWSITCEMAQTNNYLPISVVDKNATVIFYNDYEGYCTDDIFNTIHFLVGAHGFIPERCTYENLSSNIQEMYDIYCQQRRIHRKINVRSRCHYDDNTLDQYRADTPLPDVEELPFEDKKLYLNLNWNPWLHRLLMIAFLQNEELINDGYVSSPSHDKFNVDLEKDWGLLYFKTQEEILKYPDIKDLEFMEKLGRLRATYPLVLDDRSRFTSPDDVWLEEYKNEIYKYRKNSLFDVVSETYAHGPVMFTEKTFWPIIYSTPFIQVNSKGALKHLRELGYSTFHPYIDESYDDEPDLVLRIRKIVEELYRLKRLRRSDPELFFNNYKEMIKIAEYNNYVFHKKAKNA